MALWHSRIRSAWYLSIGPALLAPLAACSAAGGGSGPPSFARVRSRDRNDPTRLSTTAARQRLPVLGSGGHGDALCSGAVIAPRVAMTAGHCVDGRVRGPSDTFFLDASNQPQCAKPQEVGRVQEPGRSGHANTVTLLYCFFYVVTRSLGPGGRDRVQAPRPNQGYQRRAHPTTEAVLFQICTSARLSPSTASQDFPFDYESRGVSSSRATPAARCL